MRILRPLRFVTQNENMRILVGALVQSVGSIANVIIVMLMIWYLVRRGFSVSYRNLSLG